MCITRQLLSLGKKSENEQDKNKLNLGHTYWSNIPEKKTEYRTNKQLDLTHRIVL